MLNCIIKTYYYLIVFLAILAGLLLGMFTIAIALEAVIRSLGFSTFSGTIDFTEHSIFSMALLAAPWILYKNSHIKITLLTDQLRGKLAYGMELLCELIGTVLCIVIAYYAVEVFKTSYQRNELIFQELIIPEWWLQWQVAIAFGLMSIEFFSRLLRAIQPKIRTALREIA